MTISSIFSMPAAKATPLEPDWFNGQPFVKKSDRSYSTESCTNEMRKITLNGMYYYKEEDHHAKSWCIYHYKEYDITFYQRWFSSIFIDTSDTLGLYPRQESGMAISFDGGDLVPVDNIDYSLSQRLLYVPHSEKPLFSIECATIGCSLTFYDFITHIQPNIFAASKTYSYSAPNGEWSLTYENGEHVLVEGLGVSENGEWTSFVVRNIGLARMNMRTNSWQLVDVGYNYNVPSWYGGYLPRTSISNDGAVIGVAASSNDSRIVGASDNCVIKVPTRLDEQGQYRSGLHTNCPITSLTLALNMGIDKPAPGQNRQINNFIIAGDKSKARIYASAERSDAWYDVYPYNAQIDSGMTYLALGDSFSSGEGDLVRDGFTHYLPGTNVLGNHETGIPRELCHVSDRSYPFLLAKDMNISRGNEMQSIACSGAVRNDIYSSNTDSIYRGQPVLQFDGGTRPRLEGLTNFGSLQNEAALKFIPGRIRQIELLKKYKPRVATIGISGNDLRFVSILVQCMTNMPGQTCSYADGEGLTNLGSAIKANYLHQVDLYTALKQASPGTDLYAVGYPQFIDDEKAFCWVIGDSLTKNERTMITQAVSYANRTIKNAAATAGIKYIDIENALHAEGNDMCAESGLITEPAEKVFSAALNDVANLYEDGYVNTPASPIRIQPLHDLLNIGRNYNEGIYTNALALITKEMFHPNARAQYAMYNYIHSYQKGTSLLNDQCDELVIICPLDVNKFEPLLPDYFGVSDVHTEFMDIIRVDDGTGQRYIQQSGLATVERGKIFQIIADESLNNPNSMADVVIRSEPRTLARVEVGASGGFNAFVQMPVDMPVGYHVISVDGMAGNKMTKYVQTVFITGPQGDMDGDGITDAADTCQFITPSGVDSDKDGIDDGCDLTVKNDNNSVSVVNKSTITSSTSASPGDWKPDDWSSVLTHSSSNSKLLLPKLRGNNTNAPINNNHDELPRVIIALAVIVSIILVFCLVLLRYKK